MSQVPYAELSWGAQAFLRTVGRLRGSTDRFGNVWHRGGQNYLASKLPKSRTVRTLRRYIKELVDGGWLRVRRPKRGRVDGQWVTFGFQAYQILAAEPEERPVSHKRTSVSGPPSGGGVRGSGGRTAPRPQPPQERFSADPAPRPAPEVATRGATLARELLRKARQC